MQKLLVLAVLAALAVHVSAECANMCSGHGVCGTTDMCKCYRNWRGADCSERTCQFGRSFVDTAQGDLNHDGKVEFAAADLDFNQCADASDCSVGSADATPVTGAAEPGAALISNTHETWNPNTQAFVKVRTQWQKGTFELFPHSTKFRALNHVYMECSNKGVCNRASGECECYEGYEGSACQRTVCPNKCNGRGVCRNIKDVTQSATVTGTRTNYTYQLWDASKIQACVCDPGYSGVDCSERLCPKGDDPLNPSTQGQVDEVIYLEIDTSESAAGPPDTFTGSFRLRFTDSFGEEWLTEPVTGVTAHDAGYETDHANVAAVLLGIPNDVIPSITVTSAASSNQGRKFAITFTGNPGSQGANVKFSHNTLKDWAGTPNAITPVLTNLGSSSYKTNTECSNRGLCDYETGVCKCFRGYRLADCSGQSALAF